MPDGIVRLFHPTQSLVNNFNTWYQQPNFSDFTGGMDRDQFDRLVERICFDEHLNPREIPEQGRYGMFFLLRYIDLGVPLRKLDGLLNFENAPQKTVQYHTIVAIDWAIKYLEKDVS